MHRVLNLIKKTWQNLASGRAEEEARLKYYIMCGNVRSNIQRNNVKKVGKNYANKSKGVINSARTRRRASDRDAEVLHKRGHNGKKNKIKLYYMENNIFPSFGRELYRVSRHRA